MALTEEDFKALGKFIESKVEGVFQAKADEPKPEATPEQVAQDRVSVVGKPDTDPEAGPEFWVHLADGEVIKSFDSSSTHVNGVLVIGRYQVGE
jgi:hypothetical protein